jgi:glycosyltransferase involved in cell wall biosynthesis
MNIKRSMKIFVVEPRGSGGMIHYAYQLCSALSQYVSEVTLITSKQYELDAFPHPFQLNKLLNLWSQDGKSPASIRQSKVMRLGWMVYRNIRRGFRGIRLSLEWIKLIFFLLKKRPDIVQFGEIEFAFEALFLQFLKSRGLKLTQICHEFEPREKVGSRSNNSRLKKVFQSFSVIFFLSQASLNRFHELYPEIPAERLQTIPHGNEQIFTSDDCQSIKNSLKERYGILGTEKIVLFFGNITPSKGVPDLLNAFGKVHAQSNCARLVVAGMPLKYIDVNSLYEMVSRLGIQSVSYLDTRYIPMEEVGPLMELATVVVFPYINATQSGSIQAAYAFGKPVIATRVGGLPDVVVEGESGFLVEPSSPDELSAAILKIINQPELADKMGRYAKELSETRYAWGPIAEKIVAIYQNNLPENR